MLLEINTPELIKEAEQHWQITLGNLVVGLAECDQVLDKTKSLLKKFIFKQG